MLRRDLLTTVAAGAALSLGSRRVLGANERVRVAIIGLGGRGAEHLQSYLSVEETEVAALCDVNEAALERAQSELVKSGHKPAPQFTDMRRLFEDKEIDAVSMATPNHWHALGAIWAMQAGKDVYCEKPASHDPFEGRKMVEAARKYGRMLQVGSQGRSLPHKIDAIAQLESGVIGDVYMAKGLCYGRRKSIGHRADGAVPAGLNWDLFLGPAPMRPFNELRFKYNWHWFWDTGNGDIGNQGAHQMDIARWGLGLSNFHDGLRSVVSTGGKFVYVDDQETPNTQLASFDFGGKQLVFEVRGLLTGREGRIGSPGRCVGNVFFGRDGYLEIDDSSYTIYQGEDQKILKHVQADGSIPDTPGHIRNFLAAVKSRDYRILRADIETGAASADLCHFANISYRTGRKLTWDAAQKNWAGDAEANRLMRREYRAPYVVPDRV